MKFVKCEDIKGIPQGDKNCWMTAFLGMFTINDEALLWFMLNFLDPRLIKTRFEGYDDKTRKIIIELQTIMRNLVLDLHHGKVIDVDKCHKLPHIILNEAKKAMGDTSYVDTKKHGVQLKGEGAFPVTVIQDMFELFRIPEIKVPTFNTKYEKITKYIFALEMFTLSKISTTKIIELLSSINDYSEDYYFLYLDKGINSLSESQRKPSEVSNEVIINNINYDLVSMQVINNGHVVSLPKCNDSWFMHESGLVKEQQKMVKLKNDNGLPMLNGNNKYSLYKDSPNHSPKYGFIHNHISKYNYKRDNVILFYIKPYPLIKHKYEKRLQERYWNIQGDLNIKKINREIKFYKKQINSLIFNFELLFEPTENHYNKTRIIVKEKRGGVKPLERKKIKDKLIKTFYELNKKFEPINIIDKKHLDKIEELYFNSINGFSGAFDIQIIPSSIQRIGAIRQIRQLLEQSYVELGEYKTVADEVEFLELLKFTNNRVNYRYTQTTELIEPILSTSGAAASGAGDPIPFELSDKKLYDSQGGNIIVYNLFKKN